jgi:ATP phosphoribosyltransferase regulatory subunit
VFEAVVQALGLPLGWQKRLIHAFGNLMQLETLLAGLVSPQFVTGLDDDIAKLIASGDEAALVVHIADTMQTTGYSSNAGRSPLEIARRLKEKLILSETRLDDAAFQVLEAFLALDVPLMNASAALSGFADAAGLKLGNALARFDGRIAALGNAGVDLHTMAYRAAFGRPLDYYTGLVFEVTVAGSPAVLAGGGRFDRLMTFLGAKDRIPAVGFSLWLDRIETERAAA